MSNLTDVSVAILAGGLGTRLRPVVADRPKVLAPVGGQPYLTYLLDKLAAASVREVVLLTGYRADQVRAVLGDQCAGVRLLYSPEAKPLGTAGAVRHALPLLSSDRVLLLNGDSSCDVSLASFHRSHQRRGADCSMVLVWAKDTSRFGRVQVTADGRIYSFEEKKDGANPGWINAGVYLIERHLIEDVPVGRPVSLERDLFPRWIARRQCFGHGSRGRFLDVGTPEAYAGAEAFFSVPEARR
jgi:D-glycero-alpha-D-manno-heptose 1-phosphate guanylyltransferase